MLLSSSEASLTASACFSRNFWWLLPLSGEMPITSAPALLNSPIRQEKSFASVVQPGVSSLG